MLVGLRRLTVVASLAVAIPVAHAFGTFDAETRKLAMAVGCAKGKVSPPVGGSGRLWGCITGASETVKLFVNEQSGGGVQNVKLMWNDWWKSAGYSIHADGDLARAWAASIAATYAPTQVDKIQRLFAGKKRGEVVEGNYRLVYAMEPLWPIRRALPSLGAGAAPVPQ